jgi:hypothetical protein
VREDGILTTHIQHAVIALEVAWEGMKHEGKSILKVQIELTALSSDSNYRHHPWIL